MREQLLSGSSRMCETVICGSKVPVVGTGDDLCYYTLYLVVIVQFGYGSAPACNFTRVYRRVQQEDSIVGGWIERYDVIMTE